MRKLCFTEQQSRFILGQLCRCTDRTFIEMLSRHCPNLSVLNISESHWLQREPVSFEDFAYISDLSLAGAHIELACYWAPANIQSVDLQGLDIRDVHVQTMVGACMLIFLRVLPTSRCKRISGCVFNAQLKLKIWLACTAVSKLLPIARNFASKLFQHYRACFRWL